MLYRMEIWKCLDICVFIVLKGLFMSIFKWYPTCLILIIQTQQNNWWQNKLFGAGRDLPNVSERQTYRCEIKVIAKKHCYNGDIFYKTQISKLFLFNVSAMNNTNSRIFQGEKCLFIKGGIRVLYCSRFFIHEIKA